MCRYESVKKYNFCFILQIADLVHVVDCMVNSVQQFPLFDWQLLFNGAENCTRCMGVTFERN